MSYSVFLSDKGSKLETLDVFYRFVGMQYTNVLYFDLICKRRRDKLDIQVMYAGDVYTMQMVMYTLCIYKGGGD